MNSIYVTLKTKEYNRKLFVKAVQKYHCAEDFILAMIRNEFEGFNVPQRRGYNQFYFYEKKIGKNPYKYYKQCVREKL